MADITMPNPKFNQHKRGPHALPPGHVVAPDPRHRTQVGKAAPVATDPPVDAPKRKRPTVDTTPAEGGE